jgi:hypothetical protein
MMDLQFNATKSFIFAFLVLYFLLLIVFSDSVGVDDYIHLGFGVSQYVWLYDGFCCVGTTVS